MRVRWSWRARAALIAVLLVALLSSSRVLFGRDATPVVVRVTAAQRGDLTAAVTATGSVQSARTVDINAFTISLPALRDRRSDIVPLAEYCASRAASRSGLPAPRFSEPALVALQQHGYPGNVRELEHLIDRALVLSQGRVILPEHLVFESTRPARSAASDLEALLDLPFHESVEAWERVRISRALQESQGSKTDAARRLGIHRRLLYEKIQKLGLQNEPVSE